MLATLSDKGQFTLPKSLRDSLGLKAGSRLDFSVGTEGDVKGLLIARPLNNTALGLAGLMKRPGQKTVTLAEMDAAVLDEAALLHHKAVRVTHRKANP